MLRTADYPIANLLPNTEYFEIDSKAAGATYAVWVTTPPGHDAKGDKTYPAIFMPDGNMFAALAIPYVSLLSSLDLIIAFDGCPGALVQLSTGVLSGAMIDGRSSSTDQR